MGVYRVVWLLAACSVGGCGAVVQLIHQPAIKVSDPVLMTGLLCWLIYHSSRARHPIPGRRCRCVAAGMLGGGVCFALTGLGTVLGWRVTLVAALLFAATAPRVVNWAVTRGRGGGVPPAAQPAAPDVPPQATSSPAEPAPSCLPAVDGLTVPELCFAWRISFTALQRIQRSRDMTSQAQLVAVRQRYLDELERRDPSGFQRWLYAGARPASDPSRYVRTPTEPPDTSHS